MSQDISNIRRALTKVPTEIKQGNYMAAVKSLRGAASALVRAPLMRAEQEEFTRLVGDYSATLRYNKEISQIFPLAIEYVPGQEQALVETLDQLMEALNENATESMREALRKMEERKQATLEKGRRELEEGAHDAARATLGGLVKEFDTDAALAENVGEAFLQAGLYTDAVQHMEAAAELSPDSANLFNNLGILLRRMKMFPEAEQSFGKALALEPGDPNLHFNLGRLYLDMQQWQESLQCAEKAQAIAPEFAEAGKLAAYCRRQLGL